MSRLLENHSYLKRLVFISLIIFPVSLFSQNIKVSVSDAGSDEHLPFANIYFKTAGIGASTNMEGAAIFKLADLVDYDTLLVSYIGYENFKQPFSKDGLTTISVSMIPSSNRLKEFVVTAERPPKPEKIIREAIKKVDDNYPTSEVSYQSLYRESVKENGTYIQLNEGIIETYYTGYPQKKLDSKIWEDWYYDESYAFDLQGNRYIMPLLNDFNTKQDRQSVIASRHSKNLSQFGIDNSLIGDPLLLFALDKIKYQYDFLYPKLLNKYHFELEGEEDLFGETCYVISFYPKETKRNFISNQSRKTKSAIYVGRIFIAKESKAVTKFEYRLAVDRDYGFFARRVPLDFRVEFIYQKIKGKYYVKSIKQSSTKTVDRRENGEAILHKMDRELFVLDIESENPSPLADSTLFKSTRFSSIQYYPENYNPSYWDTLELPSYLKISGKLRTELERNEPLNAQFESFKQPQKLDLAPPKPAKNFYEFNYPDTIIVDSLHWMALLQYEDEFKTYLTKENEYARNEIIEDKAYQRKLFDQLNTFYPDRKDSTKTTKIGAYTLSEDSLGNEVLLYRKDSIGLIQAVNFTALEEPYTELYLKRVIPNKSKSFLAIQYEEVGSLSDFALIIPFGESEVLCSIPNVYSMEWLDDFTIVYSKEDKHGRAGELYTRGITSPRDSLLFVEEDKTFDIEVIRDNESLFCTVQSKTENEIYRIEPHSEGHTLALLKGRESGVQNTIKAFDAYYLLVSDENRGASILRMSFDQKDNWETIAQDDQNFHTEDFTLVGNRLVVNGYEKSVAKLKYFELGSKKWKDLDLKFGLGRYSLYSKQTDPNSLSFSFSSPALPSRSFVYHFDTEELEKKKVVMALSPMKYQYNTVKRMWAKSHDGVKIPITVVRNMAGPKESNGLILKVYGAYGANTTPDFYAQESILLQEGYTIAYAHVRGESILGADWYKQGRVLQKKNSILDYLACTEYLIKKKLTTSDKLVGYGNSAGGLVVAQAANLRPDLFNTLFLDHPYLDVVNTMMNDTLPLTVDEYKEWGNPNEELVFDCIMEYSPYQNIKPQEYPNVLLIAGYEDFRTPVWQIAKYAAKLRENNLGTSEILLCTDMSSGHVGSTSGKEWVKAFAKEYSFVRLKLIGD